MYYFKAKDCPFCDNTDDSTSYSRESDRTSFHGESSPCTHEFDDTYMSAHEFGISQLEEELKKQKKLLATYDIGAINHIEFSNYGMCQEAGRRWKESIRFTNKRQAATYVCVTNTKK